MPRVSVELPEPAYERLVAEAVRNRRPVPWEAEVRLHRSLKVPLGPARTDVSLPRRQSAAATPAVRP